VGQPFDLDAFGIGIFLTGGHMERRPVFEPRHDEPDEDDLEDHLERD